VQIGVLAGRLRTVLLRSRTLRRTMNKIAGTIYAALATRLVITN
jgi:threonine/homoserine/homoserine lactone efflux protein